MITIYQPPLPKRVYGYAASYKKFIPEPTLEAIMLDVCDAFGENISDVVSKEKTKGTKSKEFVRCRRIYCYVAHVLTSKSCTEIADYIYRDHTSFLHQLNACFYGFKYNDDGFMVEWNHYSKKSKVWKKYFPIRLQQIKQYN